MIDFKYLYEGVCGPARAHRAGTMAGRLGAAVVAGYFFGGGELLSWFTKQFREQLREFATAGTK